MSKTAYHLQLKGFVGGADFDRKAIDNILEKNQGKQVNVLIDSTGGNLATGLSITSVFKNHGNVAVHFVGLNASADTIASLGASHISIDAGAMYLVHQCSMLFFNRSNNEDIILAIQTAGVSRGLNDFKKDKSGEKLAESEKDLLEHLTDGTDTLPYIA